MTTDPFAVLPGDLGSDLVGLLEEVLAARGASGRQEAAAAIDALAAELRARFAHEDELMRLRECPHLAEHAAAHAAFLGELAATRRDLARCGLEGRVGQWLGSRCGWWMRNHARTFDAELAQHVTGEWPVARAAPRGVEPVASATRSG